MWISRQINKNYSEPSIQSGRVTLNGSGGLEAVSTGVERSVDVFSPFGYFYSVPANTDMLLARFDGRQGAIGTAMESEALDVGEIKITCPSGAYIHLKNDGSVVINGTVISKTGEINGKKY